MKTVNRAFTTVLIAIAAFAFAAAPAAQANDWDEQPAVKKSVAPDNPNGLTGMVMATIVIDEKGFVTDASIAKSTDGNLDGPTIAAVKQWIFTPAKKGGEAISCKINVPFKFKG
ncbi:energy transducer TonB [Pelagicoccus sp. SDUM812003]|uniref:energy transducer TonB n=1 Tax=Pelagicoccus sp. SDUM812003 TaxID=3041267 RepID=UPI0028108AD7|nr:energy transducer TonB [Pelagicoccus sp. SDUM812003]MDQ8204435.1 energy transducer TonB [Pelagicoccus sp. SDUM812003]